MEEGITSDFVCIQMNAFLLGKLEGGNVLQRLNVMWDPIIHGIWNQRLTTLNLQLFSPGSPTLWAFRAPLLSTVAILPHSMTLIDTPTAHPQ
jgi:hypothetical protein